MYKVSVVTPFHNVELGVFEKAYQSMKAQTIGFENIQWIVIAHNCEPHYLPALQEMLGRHPRERFLRIYARQLRAIVAESGFSRHNLRSDCDQQGRTLPIQDRNPHITG